MKVMHVASKDLPVPAIRGGAVQLWIDKVSRELAEIEGTEVAVVSPWDSTLSQREHVARVEHFRIRFSRIYVRIFRKWLGTDPFGYPWRVAKIIGTWKPDILHIHGGGSTWLPLLRKRFPDLPIVIHLHNDPGVEEHKWPFRDWHRVWFVACSRFIAEVATDVLQLPTERLSVVWNGVDCKEFKPWFIDSSIRSAQRKEWGISDEAKLLLFCGRVAPEKGPDWLAKSAASLMADDPLLWCIFVGDYHAKPVKGKEEWHATYQEINSVLSAFKDRVIFTGPISPEKMPSVFSAGDIFVSPVQGDEGFGMVFVEAMAAGLPVIGAPRGGVPEVISADVGLMVNSIESLTFKLQALLGDNDSRKNMAKAARRRAEELFSWHHAAKSLSHLYAAILKPCDVNDIGASRER